MNFRNREKIDEPAKCESITNMSPGSKGKLFKHWFYGKRTYSFNDKEYLRRQIFFQT